MSRAYRISVSESASRVVCAEDSVSTTLELLPILEARRMADLLGAELTRRGFVEAEKGTMTRTEPDGVEIAVELETGKVTVRLADQSKAEATITRSRTIDLDHRQASEERLRAEVQQELDAKLDKAQEALRRDVTARLERALGDVRQELDQAVAKATAEALKQRAAEIGTIEEMVEDETGSITIKVRV